jgi:hypothetical protein
MPQSSVGILRTLSLLRAYAQLHTDLEQAITAMSTSRTTP